MSRRIIAALGLAALAGSSPLIAADAVDTASVAAPTPAATPVVKLGGMLFADYYWVAADHAGQFQNLNGVQIRRAWLTGDSDLGNGFSGRLRLELAGGDFASATGSAWAAPTLKDAWVKWGYAAKQSASFGIIEGVVLGPVEKLWGLRSVEKTPLDLQGIEPTREQGLSFNGDLGKTNYGVVLSNGANLGNQGDNNGKKLGLSVTQGLPANLLLNVAGEYSNSFNGQDIPSYTYLLQALLGFKTDRIRAGLQYDRVETEFSTLGQESYPKELVSAFVVGKVWGKASAFARVDHLLYGTLDHGGETYLQLAKLRSTLSILGLDYPLAPGLNLQPNVEWVNYQSDDIKGVAVGNATADCIPRVTMAYVF